MDGLAARHCTWQYPESFDVTSSRLGRRPPVWCHPLKLSGRGFPGSRGMHKRKLVLRPEAVTWGVRPLKTKSPLVPGQRRRVQEQACSWAKGRNLCYKTPLKFCTPQVPGQRRRVQARFRAEGLHRGVGPRGRAAPAEGARCPPAWCAPLRSASQHVLTRPGRRAVSQLCCSCSRCNGLSRLVHVLVTF